MITRKTIALLVTLALLLGCNGTGGVATPAAPPESRPPGWEEYATPISVPDSDIASIAIAYDWTGWGERKLARTVEKVDDEYRSGQGDSVDTALIATLADSLTNLRRSGSLKSCLDHTDDYPNFNIEITYENGSKAALYSDSNCPQNVPWNVVYDDNLYVQYTGEIPTALRTLLGSLVDDPEEKDLISSRSDWLGFAFPVTSAELPAGMQTTRFSEKELFLHVLAESGLFKPFASEYEADDLTLSCTPDADNQDCSALDGTITLNAKDGGVVYALPVEYDGLEISEISHDIDKIEKISRRIAEHALTKGVRRLEPDAGVQITCSEVSPCDKKRSYQNIHASLGLTTPSECSLCAISFDGWAISHKFIYFPDIERMWVERLQYGVGEFQANKDVLGLENVLAFYRTPGYETFVDDHIIVFGIQACQEIKVFYELGVLEANPDYVSSLGETATNYANRIDIHDYCVFVNAQGELEAEK